ncbi:MAG: hypothetical protein ACYTA3_02775 [Planctomycetota bacterium]
MRPVEAAAAATIFVAAIALPQAANAQHDSGLAAHATLRGWEERGRLRIFDRSGNIFGRNSDQGILQRFHPDIDTEYWADIISYAFSLTEVYEWYERGVGARFNAGSIDHLRLVQNAQVAGRVSLGGHWDTRIQLTQQNTLQSDRALVEVQIAYRPAGGPVRTFFNTTLKPLKAETDLEVGAEWSVGGARLTAAVAVLDPFTDLIYQNLGGLADTALDYLSQPFTARTSLEIPLGEKVRVEAHGLLMTPTTVDIYPDESRDEGFRQDERYAYAGGLVEWNPSAGVAVGGFGTWVGSRLDREPLPQGQPEDHFDLKERTWQAGGYLIHFLSSRFSVEARLSHVWRTESRLRPDTSVAPNIDYEDRTWVSRSGIRYSAPSGFRAELGLDLTLGDVIREGNLPGASTYDVHNKRLRADLGWRFGQRAYLILGSNVDLDFDDNDTPLGIFDGGHGRFALYW